MITLNQVLNSPFANIYAVALVFSLLLISFLFRNRKKEMSRMSEQGVLYTHRRQFLFKFCIMLSNSCLAKRVVASGERRCSVK